MRLIALLCTLVLLNLDLTTRAAENSSKDAVKSTQLARSLFMLQAAGGNVTALLGPDGVLLVDDDFSHMADELVIKLNELQGASPRFVINTHFHYDHTGGNDPFGRTATIIAASTVRDRMMAEQVLWNRKHPPVAQHALPIVTFEQELTLHLNDEDVRILHLPQGHTDGDTVVLFDKGKVASLGDLYFAGMYPIFHLEHNGSLDGYLKNIATILSILPEDCKIVPGHGPLSTVAELAIYHQMIVASVATVSKGIAADQTLEQIQKIGLAPEWEAFSHGYATTDRWIAMIYDALRSKKHSGLQGRE